MSQNQSSSSSHSNSKQKKQNRKRSIPLMQPALKVKLKTRQVVINLSMTHYDVITDVAEQLQWKIQYSSKKGDWDVLWVDHMIEPDTLIKMHFFQKISHFPGIYVLARKNLLGLSFTQMAKKFPEDYNFFPKTWLLPAEFPELRQDIEKSQLNNEPKCYIVKPEADCQGRGIFLTFKTDEVENGKHYVVQKYLENPFLVQGLKFDFRVYVLLCGTNPMRLYVYEEGLARFATEKYEPPSKTNIKKMCMHLTNYAINKKNPKYIFNTSIHNMSTGHKRTLTSVFKNIEKRGMNIQSFKKKLDDVLVKTIIMGQPLVSHQYKFAQPDDEYRNMCFHILGVDVMVDQLLDPYVLQVNHTPSFATDTPLDYFIKFNLIKDTLVLMNINEESKKQLVKKTNNYQRERVTNAKRLIQNQQQRQRIKQAQTQRDTYESTNQGKYRKIYPVNDEVQMQKYSQFLKYADKTYFSQNNVIKAQIDAERQKHQKNAKQRQKAMSGGGISVSIGGSTSSGINSINYNSYNSNAVVNMNVQSSSIGGSRKSLQKKGSQTQSSSLKKSQIQRDYRSQSQKQIEEGCKKNSSTQFFPNRQSRASSLLNNPLNSLTSNYSSRLGNIQTPGFVKIAKSISEFEQEYPPCNRLNLVKNLPKIEHVIGSPVKKSSTIESQKNKYVSLRRKKITDGKQQKIRDVLNRPQFKQSKQMQGAFLTPKVMKFNNQQEQRAQLQRQEKYYFMGVPSGGNTSGF